MLNRSRLITIWTVILLFCFFLRTVFAGTIHRRYYSRTQLTKPSFSIKSNQKYFSEYSHTGSPGSGKFSKPSFVITSQKRYYSKVAFKNRKFFNPPFKINQSYKKEFSKPSFSISGNKGEFSTSAFTIKPKAVSFLADIK